MIADLWDALLGHHKHSAALQAERAAHEARAAIDELTCWLRQRHGNDRRACDMGPPHNEERRKCEH